MKFVKRLLIALVALVFIIALASQLLPGSYRVERRIMMHAAPETVFAKINTPSLWPTWSAWNPQRFPQMRQTFSGEPSGVGATSTWEGEDSGQGTFTITQSEAPHRVVYDLAFDHATFRAIGTFTLMPQADGVEVVWATEGQLGPNPVHRIAGLFMENLMAPDIEKGLENLKKQAEAAQL